MYGLAYKLRDTDENGNPKYIYYTTDIKHLGWIGLKSKAKSWKTYGGAQRTLERLDLAYLGVKIVKL